jgi:serine protease AprX
MLTALTLSAAFITAAPIESKALAQAETGYFLVLNNAIVGKDATTPNAGMARLQHVYQRLHAQDASLKAFAQEHQLVGERFWLVNALYLKSSAERAKQLAQDARVHAVSADPLLRFQAPMIQFSAAADVPKAITPGQTLIGAPRLWALGIQGAGVVLAGADTGYAWQHPGLRASYRGWDGAAANHHYNWFDGVADAAINSGGSCGILSQQPCDDGSHGTHTMGTMVGDDGAGEQVGAAPQAKWIGCRNMAQGDGRPSTYLRCMQWLLAPTDLTGANADLSKTPHVVNNSWGCPPSETCNDVAILRNGVSNLRAAGILFVVAAGNSGNSVAAPGCGTVSDPPAIYSESFTVGNITLASMISSSSSRGPVTVDGSNRRKPDVSAPGSGIRSTVPPAGYASFSGTSMAAPHVAGAAALLMSAYPELKFNPEAVQSALEQTAVPITLTGSCGDIAATSWPNNIAGFGRIDVYAAYRALSVFKSGFEGTP